MKKRLIAAALWWYFAWYALSLYASLSGAAGLTAAAPVIGALVGAFVAWNPHRRLWRSRGRVPATT